MSDYNGQPAPWAEFCFLTSFFTMHAYKLMHAYQKYFRSGNKALEIWWRMAVHFNHE
jgi:hypothetical protein